ncbi:MAG: class D sortase [Oscillospiraceae bacterium]|nr:class D sortase [Oscillospiraceae bacterium]
MKKYTKRQIIMLVLGILMMAAGLGILSFLSIRKLNRDHQRKELMKENTVLSIPALHIQAPVIEGVEPQVLSKAVGHFPDTGEIGSGNYCIAGHSSVLYKEYLNRLKKAEIGMEIILTGKDGTTAAYYISETQIVNPDETWILEDFGDTRVTIVTCTDDGTQRLIVVGKTEQPS